jgi:hypothetical protein
MIIITANQNNSQYAICSGVNMRETQHIPPITGLGVPKGSFDAAFRDYEEDATFDETWRQLSRQDPELAMSLLTRASERDQEGVPTDQAFLEGVMIAMKASLKAKAIAQESVEDTIIDIPKPKKRRRFLLGTRAALIAFLSLGSMPGDSSGDV